MKIITLALLAIVLSFALSRMRLFKRKSVGKNRAIQLGMAALIGAITINLLLTRYGNVVFKYSVVGVGILSCIAIVVEMLSSKKEQTQDAKR